MLGRVRQVLVSRPRMNLGRAAKAQLKGSGGLAGALQWEADAELGATAG
jgi:hypothetical protein